MDSAQISVRIFFFNDTATTEIYTLSLHDALPIWSVAAAGGSVAPPDAGAVNAAAHLPVGRDADAEQRSEEHTSELQSLTNLVCRLLLEKKKKNTNTQHENPHAATCNTQWHKDACT